MTFIRIYGINTVRARSGAVYRYHRATGKRVVADPNRAPEAFLAELKSLEVEVMVAKAVQPAAKAGSLGALFALYKGAPEFLQLKPASKKGYQRAIDVLKSQHDKPLAQIAQPYILEMRDEVFAAGRGRWLANMVVKTLSVVLGWGLPRGHVATNVAKGVPKIRRSTSAGVANKAWQASEVEAILRATESGLKKAIALAYYAGLRKADVVALPRSARRKVGKSSSEIDMSIISKNGRELTIFEAKRLQSVLDEPDPAPKKRTLAPTLVVNRWGKPYTADGLDTVFDRAKRQLAKAGTIRTGLTFHGLRKSLGKRAADMGLSENDIAGALGQTNPASSRPYTIEAARTQGARRVFKALAKKR
ncbi:MAG: tyrosine recombinase XerC [Reyranellales bacterium]